MLFCYTWNLESKCLVFLDSTAVTLGVFVPAILHLCNYSDMGVKIKSKCLILSTFSERPQCLLVWTPSLLSYCYLSVERTGYCVFLNKPIQGMMPTPVTGELIMSCLAYKESQIYGMSLTSELTFDPIPSPHESWD